MINSKNLFSLHDFNQILFYDKPFLVSADELNEVKYSFQFLKDFAKDKVIYGINTGFGPMAQYRISDNDTVKLQFNLIRSHCSGSGNSLDSLYVKAAMVARLNTLLLAKSGVHPSVVLLLKNLINNNVTPFIYEHGGVGASGDLVQLAHVALCLIGEGKVVYNNQVCEASEVLETLGLKPIEIHLREGLAIMNGTSVMTGIGLVNLFYAQNLLELSVRATALINEIIGAYDDYFSPGINLAKQHVGQSYIAQELRAILQNSTLVKKREEYLYVKTEEEVFSEKVQEYYSIRCVPQILGPIYDTIESAKTVLANEINSVNDNPVIDYKNKQVYHGGNFHGDYVSMEMDKLKMAITKLSMLVERQLNYLMNHNLNQKFTPFLNKGVLGLNFGLQGVQFTATSTVAENQTLSFPMYLHSISNNNDNQDIVSMGTNGALLCKKVIDNTYEVLAIHFMAISQAVSFDSIQHKLSDSNQDFMKELDKTFTPFVEDSAKYEQIKKVKDFLFNYTKQYNDEIRTHYRRS
jgi:histidine ammonia-lyase